MERFTILKNDFLSYDCTGYFHLDHMDQACWEELGTLWDAIYENSNYLRHTQDH